ncbi:hypothetical protein N9W57_03665 [Pseudomonadales bacterium]|nr:hypothetical protein [Pseudomonadales bacterium]
MNKIFALIMAVMASMSANAAHVTMTTPAVGGGESYLFSSQSHNVFKNFVKAEAVQQYRETLGLVTPEENDGEELIYLGLHQNNDFLPSNGLQNTVEVNLNNLNPDNGSGQAGTTGDVSLVLSAAESLSWDVSVDDNIDLNSIFIFSTNDQALTINNQAVDLSSNDVVFQDINIEVSPVAVCGYALPDDGEGCHTDRILGFNRVFDDQNGDEQETNAIFANYLGDLTDLAVTSFNGSYIVDSFDIDIDSSATVVPLPGSLVLYGSAVVALTLRRRKLQ